MSRKITNDSASNDNFYELYANASLAAQTFGVVADGVTDCTTQLQNAIYAASPAGSGSSGGGLGLRPLQLPNGTIKYTGDIFIPPGVVMLGFGRNFSTVLMPYGNARLVIDGSLYTGGFDFRIDLLSFVLQLTNCTATDGLYITSAYNIRVGSVWVYDQPAAVTNGITIKTGNDIELDSVIMYGKTTGTTRGLNLDGTGGVTSVKARNLDIENYNRGIKSAGNVVLDMITPYSERCIVGYDHGASTGSATIYGGSITTTNGYAIDLNADNLNVYGTQLGDAGSGYALNVPVAAPPYRNVSFNNVPNFSSANINAGGAYNASALNVYPSQINKVYRRTVDFSKSLTSGVATNLIDLDNWQNFAKFRLTIMSTVGAAAVIKQSDFVITSQTITGGTDPITTALSSFTNGNWGLTLGNTTLTASGTKITVGVTATTSGALGTGQPSVLYCTLDVFAYNGTGTGTIKIL